MWTYIPKLPLTYSPVTAASILPSDSLESNPEPCAMSSGTSTASKSSKPVSKTVSSTMPQSGTMSESSTVHPGVAEWISSLPAHRANPTVKPANCAGPMTIGTSSPILSESLARYSPEESMWRTCQVSMFDQRMDGPPTGQLWSESWPRSGTTVDGTLYQRRTLAHRISENGGGLWPTPAAASGGTHTGISAETAQSELEKGHQIGLGAAVAMWPTPVADGDRTTNYKQGGTSLGFAARSPMLPTPSATKNTPNTVDVADLVDSDGNPWQLGRKPYDRRTGQPVSTTLADVVKTKGWSIPTPTPSDNWTGNLESSQQSDDSMHSVTLPGFVQRFPTPSTMDHIERKGMRPSRAATNRTTGYLSEEVTKWPTPHASCSTGAGTQGREGGMNLQTAAHDQTVGGQLSATWVCWLMGLPLGWDSLEPLAEGAYEEWAGHMSQGTWWAEERGLPRLAEGQKDRVNRLKCLGNGVVPASGALAFITLEGE